ncbi:MAG: alpha/beta fold hydrolase [Candidatus Dormibacteraeota bacterium]|nr:alpha/beta fold hydrolase [Candidatus Dormibacteraeota bacterium]
MLTDAATGTPHLVPPRELAKVAAGLARHPDRVARRLGTMGAELARVVSGGSMIAPARGDRRFTDSAWGNWIFRRVLQSYLTLAGTVDGLLSDAELDWRTERQARLAAANMLDALAPTNFPWTNPAVLKETVERGGANFVDGLRNFARDMSRPPRLPATVDTSKFEVGENLGVTPGSVVLRTEVMELIQYEPQTDSVREVPLLFVPPTINKFYVLDIAPGRSMIEYYVRQGQQVFAISWRNPDGNQGHFDFDTYSRALLEARDAVAAITGSSAVHVCAACSGGMLAAAAVAHLAATKRGTDVASLSLFVCAIDNQKAGTVSALTSREVAAAAIAESARRGYLDGRALEGVFTWLRPNDLVWSYVVNNYLLGKAPPAFDILYWNQDTVRLAAGLHRDFIHIALDNSLAKPGAFTALGTKINLAAVRCDVYAVAGLTDHIIPWENAYRSAQLFGGAKRFVLSTSGHIQALVNPPSPESRSSFRVTDDVSVDAEEFLERAAVAPGSWWTDYDAWLDARSGNQRPAPESLGNTDLPALARAPGSYVHAS